MLKRFENSNEFYKAGYGFVQYSISHDSAFVRHFDDIKPLDVNLYNSKKKLFLVGDFSASGILMKDIQDAQA